MKCFGNSIKIPLLDRTITGKKFECASIADPQGGAKDHTVNEF